MVSSSLRWTSNSASRRDLNFRQAETEVVDRGRRGEELKKAQGRSRSAQSILISKTKSGAFSAQAWEKKFAGDSEWLHRDA
jgi:hypothetical protein